MPYVYFLKNKTTGLKYIGVRYAQGSCPSDFWNTYFTSSSFVKKLVDIYGRNDFKYRIIHIFDKAEDAILKENDYLLMIKDKNKKNYMNLNYSLPVSLDRAAAGGKIGGKLASILKIGLAGLSSEERSRNGAIAGKKGGTKQKELRLGIHKQSKEERLEILSYARKIQLDRKANMFIDCDREKQSERGKKGGIKNKGFVWVNDGKKSYKFTTKMQKKETLDSFIERTGYSKGRIKKGG